MARVLTKEQSSEVKEIREKIRALQLEDWLCEGADDSRLALFNNATDDLVIVDYYGNVKSSTCDISEALQKRAIYEGQIAQICYS